MRQVNLMDQSSVVNDASDGWYLVSIIEPIDGVHSQCRSTSMGAKLYL